MKFHKTPLPGAVLIESEDISDDRGYFSRTFCTREFALNGIEPCIAQASVSFNRLRGTLRGLHFQAAPHQEAKTVRCIRGAIFDVIVDLRDDSPTYRRWYGTELTAARNLSLHAPKGFAHGFITLEDDSTVEYHISEEFVPSGARGVRFDDPTIGVVWPIPPSVISSRDLRLPHLAEVLGV